MSVLAVRVCQVARALTLLLDEGHHLDLLETRRHVLDGDLLIWLDRRYPQHNLGLAAIPTVDQAELHERFEDMAVARVERRYGVHCDGLCLLLAYCIETTQTLLCPD